MPKSAKITREMILSAAVSIVREEGAEALGAGSSVFGATDPEQAIIDMLNS